jgi:hypothetical protein
MGYGIDTSANRVGVRISSAAPDAADRINEHFGWADVAIVVSDGTGALVLPSGTLKVVARNRAGKPVAHARCDAVPDLAGAYETPLPPPTTDSHGICQFTVPATGYWKGREWTTHRYRDRTRSGPAQRNDGGADRHLLSSFIPVQVPGLARVCAGRPHATISPASDRSSRAGAHRSRERDLRFGLPFTSDRSMDRARCGRPRPFSGARTVR